MLQGSDIRPEDSYVDESMDVTLPMSLFQAGSQAARGRKVLDWLQTTIRVATSRTHLSQTASNYFTSAVGLATEALESNFDIPPSALHFLDRKSSSKLLQQHTRFYLVCPKCRCHQEFKSTDLLFTVDGFREKSLRCLNQQEHHRKKTCGAAITACVEGHWEPIEVFRFVDPRAYLALFFQDSTFLDNVSECHDWELPPAGTVYGPVWCGETWRELRQTLLKDKYSLAFQLSLDGVAAFGDRKGRGPEHSKVFLPCMVNINKYRVRLSVCT